MTNWSAGWREPAPASAESSWQRIMRLNFWTSVWFSIGFVVLAVGLAARDPLGFDARWSPYTGRVLGGGLALVAVQLMLWFHVFRHGGTEARGAAGLMGAWWLLLIVVRLLQASIGLEFSGVWALAFLYPGVSHLAYAAFGSRARF